MDIMDGNFMLILIRTFINDLIILLVFFMAYRMYRYCKRYFCEIRPHKMKYYQLAVVYLSVTIGALGYCQAYNVNDTIILSSILNSLCGGFALLSLQTLTKAFLHDSFKYKLFYPILLFIIMVCLACFANNSLVYGLIAGAGVWFISVILESFIAHVSDAPYGALTDDASKGKECAEAMQCWERIQKAYEDKDIKELCAIRMKYQAEKDTWNALAICSTIVMGFLGFVLASRIKCNLEAYQSVTLMASFLVLCLLIFIFIKVQTLGKISEKISVIDWLEEQKKSKDKII